MNAQVAARLIVHEMGLDNGCVFKPTDTQLDRLKKALRKFRKETGEELTNAFCEDMGCGLCYYGRDEIPMVYDDTVGDYVPWKHKDAKSWPELDQAIDDIFNGEIEE